ncbi:MAG: hypothetical protein Q9165_001424 [Trypethelium subeluteriae]
MNILIPVLTLDWNTSHIQSLYSRQDAISEHSQDSLSCVEKTANRSSLGIALSRGPNLCEPEVNYEKLAVLGGFKHAGSANAAWSRIKRKVTAVCDIQETVDSKASTASTAASKAGAAQDDDNDADDDDDDEDDLEDDFKIKGSAKAKARGGSSKKAGGARGGRGGRGGAAAAASRASRAASSRAHGGARFATGANAVARGGGRPGVGKPKVERESESGAEAGSSGSSAVGVVVAFGGLGKERGKKRGRSEEDGGGDEGALRGAKKARGSGW